MLQSDEGAVSGVSQSKAPRKANSDPWNGTPALPHALGIWSGVVRGARVRILGAFIVPWEQIRVAVVEYAMRRFLGPHDRKLSARQTA